MPKKLRMLADWSTLELLSLLTAIFKCFDLHFTSVIREEAFKVDLCFFSIRENELFNCHFVSSHARVLGVNLKSLAVTQT